MDKQAEVATRAKGGGRRRSEAVRQSILSAALFLMQSEPLQSITIEAIAREAGVSKATIYRWWTSKALVAIDAFIENHIIHTPMRFDIHPAEALIRHWRAMAEQYSGWPGQVVAQILAEGQSDPTILREFRQRFHYGRRAVVREVVEQLMRVCEVGAGINAEELMDMLYASIYMRLLWGHAPIDAAFIRDYPLAVFKLLGLSFDDDLQLVAAPR